MYLMPNEANLILSEYSSEARDAMDELAACF